MAQPRRPDGQQAGRARPMIAAQRFGRLGCSPTPARFVHDATSHDDARAAGADPMLQHEQRSGAKSNAPASPPGGTCALRTTIP